MTEAAFMIIGLIFGIPLLIYLFAYLVGEPTDKEKYYYYKTKEYEEKTGKKVNSYRDMK